MAFEITIPRLGWSMEEGTFSGWLKSDGDRIVPGDVLFELEGEKALQEIEALDAGILRIPPDGPAPGTVLKVGARIGFLVADGEASPWEATAPVTAVEPPPGEPGGEAAVASPSLRRLARSLGVSLTGLAGTGVHGRVTEEDVQSAASGSRKSDTVTPPDHGQRRTNATPRAKRTARRLGIDWTLVTGTGRNGRIRERDVLAANPGTQPGDRLQGTSRMLSGRRRVIAERLAASQRQTVPVTLTTRANATNLVALREQFRLADSAAVPAYHDIIAKLVAECLAAEPLLAGRRDGDAVVLPEAHGIHIGLAVDTPDGLLVPVLRDVLFQPLPGLSASSARLIQRAREGRLTAAEMDGGVFTIINLGSFGIDAFTPVINLPETAILGLGAIRREPVVTNDNQIVIGQLMTLSLTFDHQLIDGAPAARFLQSLVRAIETPAVRLLEATRT